MIVGGMPTMFWLLPGFLGVQNCFDLRMRPSGCSVANVTGVGADLPCPELSMSEHQRRIIAWEVDDAGRTCLWVTGWGRWYGSTPSRSPTD
eukprot:jgi/Botrbrau1/18441/Bobra.0072s0028.1